MQKRPLMNCLVTCGPTYEPLDEVRRLTNFSTGKLGTELSNYLTAKGHRVALLRGEQATYTGPAATKEQHAFTTGEDLAQKLYNLASESFDAVFHAAAVSDYRFGRIWNRLPDGTLKEIAGGKLSTRQGSLRAELLPTEKILPKLREWFPRALIVGWKFEVEGNRDSAIQHGAQQTRESDSDFCVLNGPAYGPGFGVIHPGGKVQDCLTDEELYRALIKLLEASRAT